MATSSEPLLNSTKRKTFSFKSLYIFIALVAAVCSIAVVSIAFFPGSNYSNIFHSIKSTNICEHAADQSSCLDVVSQVTSTPYSVMKTNEVLEILQMLLHKTSSQIQETTTFIKNLRLRINNKREQSALRICSELMDMSRDRITDSMVALGNSIYFDAHTWLSAVLTNHNTCMDELEGHEAHSIIKPILKDLISKASASLALMVKITPKNLYPDELREPLGGDFPSWVSPKVRVLLEDNSELLKINANVVVAKDGSGKYKTVKEAIASAPTTSDRYIIHIKKGTYKENVVIASNKQNIMLIGDGIDNTILTGNLNYASGTGTFDTPTLACNADGFIAQELRIQNTAGPKGQQAVALRITGDKAVINRCKIDAYQDTLYAHNNLQFYKDCYITGTVDFIFGNAAVVFQKCKIVARKGGNGQQNMITAQGKTDKNQPTGTSIQNCSITPSTDLAPVKGSFKTFLGRPWQIYSTTVFMESFIDNHVDPDGWHTWDGTNRGLDTLYYGEYKNTGQGADTSKRVKWKGYHVITKASEAKKFTVSQLLKGGSWIKDAGVSFISGLST